MTEPTDKEKFLNIADQCTATASNDITASILVDEGSGTLRELLNDAADAIRAGWATPQPTQAANSELEDAARLDWLALAGPTSICVVIDREYDGEVEVSTDDVTGYGKTLREAIDAARKQVAKP